MALERSPPSSSEVTHVCEEKIKINTITNRSIASRKGCVSVCVCGGGGGVTVEWVVWFVFKTKTLEFSMEQMGEVCFS